MKPITGQYECVHSSGVGLDYFTSRIDRLVVQNDGRFVLTTQNHSRATNAAKSFIKGQQAPTTVSETRMEGNYTQQGLLLLLQFDTAGSEQAHLAEDGSALQIGPNYFTKVSDSTLLPPTHRLQQDMNDIAKGLKIASSIGGMAVKASKMIKSTLQPAQGANDTNQMVQSTAQPYTVPPQAPPLPMCRQHQRYHLHNSQCHLRSSQPQHRQEQLMRFSAINVAHEVFPGNAFAMFVAHDLLNGSVRFSGYAQYLWSILHRLQ